MSTHPGELPVVLSLGIMAWNEEDSIRATLESLLRQTLFSRLAERGQRCELVVLANGCTDGTVRISREIFDQAMASHPNKEALKAWVADIPEPGRNNAWNRFVHELSAREAGIVGLMDADVVFHQGDTLERVVGALGANPRLLAASDWPVKDIALKPNKTFREKLSLSTSAMTGSIEGRLNGQLYLIRSHIARNMYLARDMVANDDGFFKAIITTNFLTEQADPARTVSVPGAAHLYEPYLAVGEILNNQKRQMIGQTTVHVLLTYLQGLAEEERRDLAATLKRNEARDPDWLKKLIAEHLRREQYFWRIFPDVLSFRWRRWARLRGAKKLTHFPAAAAGFGVTLIACWRAARFLRGGIANYWPKASRQTILAAPGVGAK